MRGFLGRKTTNPGLTASVTRAVSFAICGALSGACAPAGDAPQDAMPVARPELSGQYEDTDNGFGHVRACRPDCSGVPFTAEGEARMAAHDRDAAQEVYGTTCTVPHMPFVTAPGRYLLRLVVEEDLVSIYQQRTDTVRTARFADGPPPADLPRTRLGYSQARWEDDVLIIETTHLVGGVVGNSVLPYGDDSRIIERYWRDPDDEQLLNLEVTLEDPLYYREPFVLYGHELVARPEYEWQPWNCTML